VHHRSVTQDIAPKPPDLPTIDVPQAARYLGVSERTVRRLVASRAIGHRRVAGSLIRFTQSDLDLYVESIRVDAKGQ
jgi:excisionase family DNA binding protein